MRLYGVRNGAAVRVGSGLFIVNQGSVWIGAFTRLERDVTIKVESTSGRLSIGERVFVGRGTTLDAIEDLQVGDNTLIAPRCYVTDHDHGMEPDRKINEQSCKSSAVSIGSDVWIGYGSVVLAGVSIGDGTIVGAGSVVTKSVEAGMVVAGNPARVIRERKQTSNRN